MKEFTGSYIESELGRVNIENSERKPHIVVDDPRDSASFQEKMPVREYEVVAKDQYEGENLRDLAERARREKDTRMDSGAKKRIEILTNLGRASVDVDVDGIKFSLRTLKNGEWRESIKSVAAMNLATEQAYEMRAQVLARSLFAIDDKDVQLVIGADSVEDKVLFIQDMDDAVVSYLYGQYNEMAEKNKAKFNFNKEEDVKKAVEEVKKS